MLNGSVSSIVFIAFSLILTTMLFSRLSEFKIITIGQGDLNSSKNFTYCIFKSVMFVPFTTRAKGILEAFSKALI